MVETFADVVKEAELSNNEIVTYVDSVIPAGHFAAIRSIDDDGKAIYLLEGEKNAADAVVKGHILSVYDEDNGGIYAFGYAQDGETSLGQVRTYRGKTESFENAFAQMV